MIYLMKHLIYFTLISLFLFQCAHMRRTDNDHEVLPQKCIDRNIDSLLPLIKNLDSLVCYDYNTNLSDTIYLSNNCKSFVDSIFMKNIIACFAEKNIIISFSHDLKYPTIIIEAKYDRCKYILNLGIMKGHLSGYGSEFELIKEKNLYIIGKAVNLWIS